MWDPPSLEPTRYDGLLAAMPASVVIGIAAGWWSTLSTAAGIGAGGVLAALVVVITLFVVPPE